ncbi:MAG: TldD/PmbA family protein [bacterium]|nr:TldD/PmbA family protein [bacterium]
MKSTSTPSTQGIAASTAAPTPEHITEATEQKCADLLERSQFILDELERRKPAQNEVCASYYSELKIVYENRDFSVSAATASDMFGVRSILSGGQPGFITTNSPGDAALREAAGEVQNIAALSPAGPHFSIADPGAKGFPEYAVKATQQIAGGPAFLRVDPRLAALQPEDAIRFAELVIAEARKDSRVAIDRAEFSVDLGYSAIRNSNGIVACKAAASVSFYIMGMARDGDQVTSFDYDGDTVFDYDQIEAQIAKSVGRFRDSVTTALDPEKGDSYKGAVLLHPRTVLSLFGGVASVNCNGRMHLDGMSPWRERMGEAVAQAGLTILEDPTNPGRPQGFRPYDREGVPTSRHELISKGRLNHLAHNCYSARRAGCVSTGNAAGGASSQPAIGFSNMALELAPADGLKILPENELMQLAGDALLLKRFSGNTDHISGNFSGVAKNSYLLRGGARGPAVREIMVQGDSFDLLNSVVAAGDRNHELMGGGRAPYLLVDGLSVTAG